MSIKIVKRPIADEGLIPSGKELKPNLMASIERLNKLFASLEVYFVDRQTELSQLKMALLTKEHMLMKGAPGTAKSQMSRAVFKGLTGGKIFETQFSKFMSEDYVFGPVNVKKLREDGEIVHNTKGTLVDADFAFIDEVFDGSDVLLRSTLEIINERTFTRNAQAIACPLHTAVMTSNYVREEEATEAFNDRILFKADVQPVQDAEGRMTMYRIALANHSLSKVQVLKFGDLQAIVDFIRGNDNVEVSDAVLTVYDQVVREFMRQTTKKVSDRTCVKMLTVLKASAVLRGRKSVLLEDILSIQDAMCVANNVAEQNVFESVYHRTVVQGRKDQTELADVLRLKNRVEKIVNEKQSADEDKDTVLKIRALQKFVNEELTKSQQTVTAESAKEELDKIGVTVDAAIQGLKATLEA